MSAGVCVKKPTVSRLFEKSITPSVGMTPWLGLKPVTPRTRSGPQHGAARLCAEREWNHAGCYRSRRTAGTAAGRVFRIAWVARGRRRPGHAKAAVCVLPSRIAPRRRNDVTMAASVEPRRPL